MDRDWTLAGPTSATMCTASMTLSYERGCPMKKIVVRKAGTVRLTTAAAFYDDPSCPIVT